MDNQFDRCPFRLPSLQIKKKTIVIDPGHGGKDSGAVGIHKNLEKNITLKVGILLKKKFMKKTNFEVILTRVDDRYLKLKDRTRIAKKIMLIYLFHYMPTTIKIREHADYLFIHSQKKHRIKKLKH